MDILCMVPNYFVQINQANILKWTILNELMNKLMMNILKHDSNIMSELVNVLMNKWVPDGAMG